MRLHYVRSSAAVLGFALLWAAGLHAQAAAEYGMATATSGSASASGKALVPFPNITLPGAGSNSGGGAPGSVSAGVPAGTAESAARENMQFFQSHAGPNAASVSVHTLPDHASVWIDGRFLGPAPVNMKLAPGHHQALVRAPNMQESTQSFDLGAKQAQSVDFALKSSYQNQVVIHWPSQK
jgi:PEGA domain-containing protein